MEKLKMPPINMEQKGIMVQYLQKHPELAKQKFSSDFSFKKAKMLWQELTEILNSVPGGSKKTWIQWRKTWTDIKKNTKNKSANIQSYTRGTGGGPAIPKKNEITDLEKNILEIIGNVVQSGHDTITETRIEFNFDNDENEDINAQVIESGYYETLARSPSPEMDYYLNPMPTTSKSIDETPSFRQSNKTKVPSLSELTTNTNLKKPPSKILSQVTPPKLKKPLKCGKRLSVTRRLENSQKASADMIASMETRTQVLEKYYEKKSEYLQHKKEYQEKKLQVMERSNDICREILNEAKEIKKILCDENENLDD